MGQWRFFLPIAVSGAIVLTGCGGSSGGATPSPSTTSGASASASPSADIVANAPSRLAEPMNRDAAERVIPQLRKQPGVFRVVYSRKVERLFVYLFANITPKQRSQVIKLISTGAS
jgi:hypothetical protein